MQKTTQTDVVDENGYLYPTEPQPNERYEFSYIAAQIFSFPHALVISVHQSDEDGRYAFGIARDLLTNITPLMKTTFMYDTHEKASDDLEYTLRLIVKLFSDEHKNPATEMITTQDVDWIMTEVRAFRVAQTNKIMKLGLRKSTTPRQSRRGMNGGMTM